MTGRSQNPLCIHRAAWVVQKAGRIIPNGAVATFGGVIVATGTFDEMRPAYHGEVMDHGDSILCPALVNAHCHLELSPLKWRLTPSGSFAGWVRSLVAAKAMIQPQEWIPAITGAAKAMRDSGVIGICDVGNLGMVPAMAQDDPASVPFRGLLCHEIIQPLGDHPDLDHYNDMEKTFNAFTKDGERRFTLALSSHAVYSVSPPILVQVKEWDRKRGAPFQIHVAESFEEMEFLRSGMGPVRDLLEERGHWPLDHEIPGCSPVSFLDVLGLLDHDTVCVHGVHVNDADIEILARSGVTVCLCPRSNMFLGVGAPPVAKFLNAGVPLALGTDSLASNDTLSIFAEMSSLAAMAPHVPPEVIFHAATEAGARVIFPSGKDELMEAKRFGTLDPGCVAEFLAISGERINGREILDYLVLGNIGNARISWVGDVC